MPRWLLLLEGADNQEILQVLEEIAVKDPVLYQAMAAWEETSDDPRVREAYYDRRKAILDEKAAIREAELRLKEALEKGKEKGKAEVARKLLDLGFELTKISEATGLTEEELKNLREGQA